MVHPYNRIVSSDKKEYYALLNVDESQMQFDKWKTPDQNLFDAFPMTSGKGKTIGMEIRSVIAGAGRDESGWLQDTH